MSFQALFEHSSLGIIISSSDGVILKSNHFASKIFGYEDLELHGQKIEILIPQHLREKHIGHRQHYVKNPSPRSMGSNLNLLAIKKNGDEFPVEISLSYFEVEGVKQVVSFINDITERKRADDKLKRLTAELETKVDERTKELSDALIELSHTNAGLNTEMERRKKIEAQILVTLEKEKELNELKTRFVSMASHEFRTPLSGILTSVSLIGRYHKDEDAPKREKHVQSIKNAVKNLTMILNDFLSIDKLDQGNIYSRPVEFNLSSFLDELVIELKDMSDKPHQIEIFHADPNVILFQDKDMLRNVIINLFSNASKYSSDNSTIVLSTERSKSKAILKIQDQGIGIPEGEQKHLFERFFRANNANTVQGTGLGLTIIKRYLDLMGGDIEFQSIENVGTTFKIILPMEKA